MLALEGVDKRFGAVHAVRDVSIAFDAGRVHAVVGENGAGKSTLLRVAAGLIAADRGVVRAAGTERSASSPAPTPGVAMVQQHFALVGPLTALENFVLGAEPAGALGRLDRRAALDRARRAASEIGAEVSWDTRVDRLSLGERQRLEIVRAIDRAARILILDEPTAVLTPGEAGALYALVRRLADGGRAVIVVTHRLDEVRLHADEVSVMRHGSLVAHRALVARDAAETDALTREIMGAEPPPPPAPRCRSAPGPARIELRDLTSGRELCGLTLEVRAGEVVGLAGVDGNGQDALVRIVGGLEAPDGGTARVAAVAVVYADRDRDGLVGDATVRDNLVLGELARFTRCGFVSQAALDREAEARSDAARIASGALDTPARFLSGGNRQRVLVARVMARAARVEAMVFAQPTRGVDAAASRPIHEAIESAAAAGMAVLVVSADLGELRLLCDRIAVIARGRIVAELPPDAPDVRFGEAMLGTSSAESHEAHPPAAAP